MKTVLVVDDSSVTRQIIHSELKSGGYDVIEARSGKEAIGAMIVKAPDLITLDLDMPGMNGYETLKKLRQTWEMVASDQPFPPVVIVTGMDTMEERERGFENGATNFLVKPFEHGDLIAIATEIFNPNRKYLEMKVLVVDDSRVVRKVVIGTLKEAGIKSIWEAGDGAEALEILKEMGNSIDLVITDFSMPTMDGDEFCKKAREELNLRSVPFIFLSQLPERASVLNIFKAGATDYLVKPFVKEELIARVITHFETRLLNRTLEEKVAELTELNSIKDNLISMTSHDIRSPLSGIIGLTDMTLLDESLSGDIKENLSLVKEAGVFLLDLVNDILDLSAIQAEGQTLPMEKIDALEIADSSLKTFKQQAHVKKISLILDTGKLETCPILGNKSALTRIINNLISNAVKFTEEGGTIWVKVDGANERVHISVTDSGIGIAKEDIPKLFDRFTKKSRRGTAKEKGTGLGLCITKELVEKQGGTLTVNSEPGQGTQIALEFPACQ